MYVHVCIITALFLATGFYFAIPTVIKFSLRLVASHTVWSKLPNSPDGLYGDDTLLLLSECLTSSLRGDSCPSGTLSDKDDTPFVGDVGVNSSLVSLKDFCENLMRNNF